MPDQNKEFKTHGLSKRGLDAWKRPLRVDFSVYEEAQQNAYHPEDNPDGNFVLNIAENKCTADLLHGRIADLLKETSPPEWVRNYTSPAGHPSFLEAFGQFYGKYIAGEALDVDGLAASAGATSVIDLTSQLIGNPGDLVAFPAPNYPAYTPDIGNKGQLERLDFDLLNGDLSKGRMCLHKGLLDGLLEKAREKGKKLCALVLTQPDNPMGHVYAAGELELAADWCIENKVHLIVNEIYALSQFDPEIVPGDRSWPRLSYQSFVPLINAHQSDYLHLWYSLSKDFCASGYRVGFIYSQNKALIEAYSHWNGPSMISNITQWIFEQLFKDDAFLEHYIPTLRRQLSQNYRSIADTLQNLDLPYIHAQGSLFLWIDFSEFLKGNNQEAEDDLWVRIYNESGLLLTPGTGFGHSLNRGCFRMVYSCLLPEEISVVTGRLQDLISNWRSGN